MKLPTRLMLAALFAADLGADEVSSLPRPPREPNPADSLPPPFRDNEKIRAAEAKRERRRKRGW